MKKILFVLIAVSFLLAPLTGLAATPKTFTGTITKIVGSQLIINTTSAATYAVEVSNAQLVRKNGMAMNFSEFFVGDKIEAKGTLWGDNSVSAVYVRDALLYAHKGTFTGKVTGINPANLSFTLQSKANGDQNIQTNNFTSFSKNGSSSGFNNIELGMSMTVKGIWDRSKTNVVADIVDGSFRLINIDFTGILSMKNGNSLTVIGNGNVIYGVDVSSAVTQNKNSSPLAVAQYKIGDSVHVWGKHISGLVQITGTKVKDTSIAN